MPSTDNPTTWAMDQVLTFAQRFHSAEAHRAVVPYAIGICNGGRDTARTRGAMLALELLCNNYIRVI